jgi:hypothetical protein
LAGLGHDVVSAGAGNDHISAHDGARDIVRCGPGIDRVVADKVDVLTDCERVIYLP